MAFPTKVIPLSDAFKQWLSATFAPKVHYHDDRYSLLGHTHSDMGMNITFGDIAVGSVTIYNQADTYVTSNSTKGFWIKYPNGLLEQVFELPAANYGSADRSPYMKCALAKSYTTTSYSIVMQCAREYATIADGHGYVEIKSRDYSYFRFDNCALANAQYFVRCIGK